MQQISPVLSPERIPPLAHPGLAWHAAEVTPLVPRERLSRVPSSRSSLCLRVSANVPGLAPSAPLRVSPTAFIRPVFSFAQGQSGQLTCSNPTVSPQQGRLLLRFLHGVGKLAFHVLPAARQATLHWVCDSMKWSQRVVRWLTYPLVAQYVARKPVVTCYVR